MIKIIHLIFQIFLITQLLFSFYIYPQSFLITKYSTDNGLPDNRVNDIAQDSLGRIWIAMASGIAMYDGYEWTKFGEKDGVPEKEFSRIKVDSKGIIWFLPKRLNGSSLVFYKSKKWGLLSLKSEFNKTSSFSNAIEILYVKNQINIFISMGHKGVYLFKNNKWSILNRKNGLSCDSVSNIIAFKGRILISTYNGITILNNNLDPIAWKYNKSFPNQNILGLSIFHNDLFDSDSLLVIGNNWAGSISLQKEYRNILNNSLPFLGTNEKNFISNHFNRCIYFGNSASVYQFNPENGITTKILLEEANSDRGGNSFLIDYEGNIWLTSLRGIYKLTFIPFLSLKKESGLLENEVSAISEFNNGAYVFGHNYGITIKLRDDFKYVSFKKDNDEARILRVMNIAHSKKNDTNYFSSYQFGIGELSRNGSIKWMTNSSFNKLFYYVYINKINEINFSLNKGLFRFANFRHDKKYIEIISSIRDHCILNDNITFLALQIFFAKIKNDSITYFITSDNDANNFYSVENLNNYGILVGSAKGLFKFERDTLLKYNFNEQNITDPIYFIIQDSSKNVWLGTNNGVLKWDGKNLKRYNKSDGLAGNETNRAAGFVDRKGNVWIGTDEGVSMYTGNEPDYSKFPPKVLLLNFNDHTNKKYNINYAAEVSPDKNNLTFNYRGLSFIDEKRNSYQIRLVEVNGDYENEFYTKSTSARFNNLAAGKYIFSVRLKNSKGIWSGWKNSSIITVEEHFYNEPFFYLSVLGALFIAAFTLNDYYQQRKYNKRLEKAVEVRTKDLKETQEQLITSINRYKGIVESQTDLLIRFDENSILTFVNDAYCAMFGKKPEELIGKSFMPLVHPEDVDPTFEEMKKLKYPPYRSTIEQRDLTVDGYRWFSWEGYAVHDNLGNVLEIQAVGRDITIQKEVEAELEKRVNERTIELQSLISQSPLGILTFNSEGLLVTYNKIANEMFGSLKELQLPSKDFNILKDYFLGKNEYLTKLNNLDSPNSFLLTHPILIDEKENKLYYNLFNHYLIYRIYNVVFDENNQMYVLLIDDVTEQQKSEEITKKLLEEKIRISTIIQTIESERDRFAKELHDGLGQLLTTAKLKLDIIKLKTDKSVNEIDETVKVLINAGDEIRRIINDLKPSDVERFGLMSSVELLVERIKQASGVKILFSVMNSIQIQNKNTELIVYRIIQEALNNIVKHSQCSKASIELLTMNNQLQIHIGDDGIGYDLSKHNDKIKSYGLNNIKERINSLNGEIKIETEPGKGFKYHIKVPIK